MTKLEIFKEMENYLKVETIEEGTKFREDLNLDSIDLVNMLMDIEEKYNIEISDEAAKDITTVGQFVDLIINEVE